MTSGAKILDDPRVDVFYQNTVSPGVVEDLSDDTVAPDIFGHE